MYRSTTASVQSSTAPDNFQALENPPPQAITLTAREAEVLQWGVAGKSSWGIAKIVNCTEAGVNYHFCNIRRKFGVRSRWAAMAKALEQGLIQSTLTSRASGVSVSLTLVEATYATAANPSTPTIRPLPGRCL